ncbi:hypothetical protein [Bullifex porci]|uniref:hypothetical protein n=1 Tax=Bullifex porci TaxID=2606638 RepID=UPI0023F2DB9B|nr:hypothetical protein [Bullifex porci]MDD7588545.1 hypothetical protein [Bullifex porci]
MKNSENGIKLVLFKDKLGYRRLYGLEGLKEGHVNGDLIAVALSELGVEITHANHIYTQCKSKEDYDKLAEQIEDIDRGVKALEQLIDWAKYTFNADKEIDKQDGLIELQVQVTDDADKEGYQVLNKDKVIKEDIKSDC